MDLESTSCMRKMSFSTTYKYACLSFSLKILLFPPLILIGILFQKPCQPKEYKKIILLFSAVLILWQKKFWGLTDNFVFQCILFCCFYRKQSYFFSVFDLLNNVPRFLVSPVFIHQKLQIFCSCCNLTKILQYVGWDLSASSNSYIIASWS